MSRPLSAHHRKAQSTSSLAFLASAPLPGPSNPSSSSASSAAASGSGHAAASSRATAAPRDRSEKRRSMHPLAQSVMPSSTGRTLGAVSEETAPPASGSSQLDKVDMTHARGTPAKRKRGVEEVNGWTKELQSLRTTPDRRRQVLRRLEETLMRCCDRPDSQCLGLSGLVNLKIHTALLSLLSRHAQALTSQAPDAHALPVSHPLAAILVRELCSMASILQGLCLMSRECKSAVGESWVLEILIDLLLLLRAQPPPSSSSDDKTITYYLLDLLCCALVDSPANARTFERLSGLEAVVRVLKGTGVLKEVRMKCIEFLYFYLMPEETALPGHGQRSVSAASKSESTASTGSSLFPPTPLMDNEPTPDSSAFPSKGVTEASKYTSSSPAPPAPEPAVVPTILPDPSVPVSSRKTPSNPPPKSPSTRLLAAWQDLDVPFVPQTPQKPGKSKLGFHTPALDRVRGSVGGVSEGDRSRTAVQQTPSLESIPASPLERMKELAKSPEARRIVDAERDRDNAAREGREQKKRHGVALPAYASMPRTENDSGTAMTSMGMPKSPSVAGLTRMGQAPGVREGGARKASDPFLVPSVPVDKDRQLPPSHSYSHSHSHSPSPSKPVPSRAAESRSSSGHSSGSSTVVASLPLAPPPTLSSAPSSFANAAPSVSPHSTSQQRPNALAPNSAAARAVAHARSISRSATQQSTLHIIHSSPGSSAASGSPSLASGVKAVRRVSARRVSQTPFAKTSTGLDGVVLEEEETVAPIAANPIQATSPPKPREQRVRSSRTTVGLADMLNSTAPAMTNRPTATASNRSQSSRTLSALASDGVTPTRDADPRRPLPPPQPQPREQKRRPMSMQVGLARSSSRMSGMSAPPVPTAPDLGLGFGLGLEHRRGASISAVPVLSAPPPPPPALATTPSLAYTPSPASQHTPAPATESTEPTPPVSTPNAQRSASKPRRAFPTELTRGMLPGSLPFSGSPAPPSAGAAAAASPLGPTRRVPSGSTPTKSKRYSMMPPPRKPVVAESGAARGMPKSASAIRLNEYVAGSNVRETKRREPSGSGTESEVNQAGGRATRSVEEKKKMLGSWLGNVDQLVAGVEKVSFWGSAGKHP